MTKRERVEFRQRVAAAVRSGITVQEAVDTFKLVASDRRRQWLKGYGNRPMAAFNYNRH